MNNYLSFFPLTYLVYVPWDTCELREQPVGVTSLFPPCGSGDNLGHKARRQASLPPDPPTHLAKYIFSHIISILLFYIVCAGQRCA